LAILSSGQIVNHPVGGVNPNQQVIVKMENYDSVNSAIVFVQGYYLNGAPTLYILERVSIPPNETVMRKYFANYDAFEFVFITNVHATESTGISIWKEDMSRKLVTAYYLVSHEFPESVSIRPKALTGSQNIAGPSTIFKNHPVSLLPVSTQITLELPPITTTGDERIKLDSAFQLYFAMTNATSHNLSVTYELERIGTYTKTLTQVPVNHFLAAETALTLNHPLFPTITWVDTPPPGTHIYRVNITSAIATNIATLHVTNRTLQMIPLNRCDPFNIYVQAGAVGGNGTMEQPFGTIEEGMTAVAEGGTVHVMEGTYYVSSQLIITKPMTLRRSATTDSIPRIVFDSATNMDGVIIEADHVTIAGLHLIAYRTLSSDNAVIKVPLKSSSPITLYQNITISSCIVESTIRSGYFWAENLTVIKTEFIHNAATQSLRLQMIRGKTNILNNTFQGGSKSVGAIVFEPSIVSWTTSGSIQVSGNTMKRFTQFMLFSPHLADITSLLVENNNIDHQDRPGHSITFFTRTNYQLMRQIRIENNFMINPDATWLAVYFTTTGDGAFVPQAGQIQVYNNMFDFSNDEENPRLDTVDSEFPVGFNVNTHELGMSLNAFVLGDNPNI
jgi:hypothetical protein